VSDITDMVGAQAAGPIEEKTKYGAYFTYIGSFLLFAVLTNMSTDLTPLPDWLETILYPLLPTLIGFLGSYLKSHKPGKLSLSGLRAARHS
jgi:uncharacterized membrane protein YhdT